MRTVTGWAVDEGMLPSNVFTKVKVTVPRKISKRESFAFTADEASLILNAALAVEVKTTNDAARRWLPLLCAYTGCRGAEAAQVRGQDLVEQGGIWALRITPEAGSVKTRKPRTVPLHEHLIELGLVDYARSRGKRALFFDSEYAGPGDPTHPLPHPSNEVVKLIGRWVRGLGLKDKELRPNHSWRHTFRR